MLNTANSAIVKLQRFIQTDAGASSTYRRYNPGPNVFAATLLVPPEVSFQMHETMQVDFRKHEWLPTTAATAKSIPITWPTIENTSAPMSSIHRLKPSYAMANNVEGYPISDKDKETIVTMPAPGGDIPTIAQASVQYPATKVRFPEYCQAVLQ